MLCVTELNSGAEDIFVLQSGELLAEDETSAFTKEKLIGAFLQGLHLLISLSAKASATEEFLVVELFPFVLQNMSNCERYPVEEDPFPQHHRLSSETYRKGFDA